MVTLLKVKHVIDATRIRSLRVKYFSFLVHFYSFYRGRGTAPSGDASDKSDNAWTDQESVTINTEDTSDTSDTV